MSDAGLHVVALEIGAQSGTQIVRRRRLADGADVVALAFDREQHGALDGARLDALALPFELAGRQCAFPKNETNGFQIEFRGQIENGEVLVVEPAPSRARPSPGGRTIRDAPSDGARRSCS